MARGSVYERAWRVRCSFKQATLVVCACNLLMVVCLSQWLLVAYYVPAAELASLVYVRQADGTLLPTVLDAQEQLNIAREANRARVAAKPVRLIERVKEIRQEALLQVISASTKTTLKQTEISKRITGLRFQGLDKWRKEKLKQAQSREAALLKTEPPSQEKDKVPVDEEVMAEDEVNVLDQSEGSGILQDGAEIEDGIIPGRVVPEVCHAEAHTDYGGIAVRWGPTHHVESAADCCEACLKQARTAKSGEKKCNIWVFCPAEGGCFSPDVYEHKHQECWLKQAVEPELNFKGHYDEEYRRLHPTAPRIVPWVSGVIQS
ncbi:hypothetical protein M758_11G139100 [Ceratodon purpureus]|nr:hypothetical protein M758_11G139100 [Ceratodon purpureus]